MKSKTRFLRCWTLFQKRASFFFKWQGTLLLRSKNSFWNDHFRAVGRLLDVRITGTRGCRLEPIFHVVILLDTSNRLHVKPTGSVGTASPVSVCTENVKICKLVILVHMRFLCIVSLPEDTWTRVKLNKVFSPQIYPKPVPFGCGFATH